MKIILKSQKQCTHRLHRRSRSFEVSRPKCWMCPVWVSFSAFIHLLTFDKHWLNMSLALFHILNTVMRSQFCEQNASFKNDIIHSRYISAVLGRREAFSTLGIKMIQNGGSIWAKDCAKGSNAKLYSAITNILVGKFAHKCLEVEYLARFRSNCQIQILGYLACVKVNMSVRTLYFWIFSH